MTPASNRLARNIATTVIVLVFLVIVINSPHFSCDKTSDIHHFPTSVFVGPPSAIRYSDFCGVRLAFTEDSSSLREKTVRSFVDGLRELSLIHKSWSFNDGTICIQEKVADHVYTADFHLVIVWNAQQSEAQIGLSNETVWGNVDVYDGYTAIARKLALSEIQVCVDAILEHKMLIDKLKIVKPPGLSFTPSALSPPEATKSSTEGAN